MIPSLVIATTDTETNLLRLYSHIRTNTQQDVSAARLLLQRGVCIKGDGDDRSPLMYASQYGYTEMVSLLLEAGMQPVVACSRL